MIPATVALYIQWFRKNLGDIQMRQILFGGNHINTWIFPKLCYFVLRNLCLIRTVLFKEWMHLSLNFPTKKKKLCGRKEADSWFFSLLWTFCLRISLSLNQIKMFSFILIYLQRNTNSIHFIKTNQQFFYLIYYFSPWDFQIKYQLVC